MDGALQSHRLLVPLTTGLESCTGCVLRILMLVPPTFSTPSPIGRVPRSVHLQERRFGGGAATETVSSPAVKTTTRHQKIFQDLGSFLKSTECRHQQHFFHSGARVRVPFRRRRHQGSGETKNTAWGTTMRGRASPFPRLSSSCKTTDGRTGGAASGRKTVRCGSLLATLPHTSHSWTGDPGSTPKVCP